MNSNANAVPFLQLSADEDAGSRLRALRELNANLSRFSKPQSPQPAVVQHTPKKSPVHLVDAQSEAQQAELNELYNKFQQVQREKIAQQYESKDMQQSYENKIDGLQSELQALRAELAKSNGKQMAANQELNTERSLTSQLREEGDQLKNRVVMLEQALSDLSASYVSFTQSHSPASLSASTSTRESPNISPLKFPLGTPNRSGVIQRSDIPTPISLGSQLKTVVATTMSERELQTEECENSNAQHTFSRSVTEPIAHETSIIAACNRSSASSSAEQNSSFQQAQISEKDDMITANSTDSLEANEDSEVPMTATGTDELQNQNSMHSSLTDTQQEDINTQQSEPQTGNRLSGQEAELKLVGSPSPIKASNNDSSISVSNDGQPHSSGAEGLVETLRRFDTNDIQQVIPDINPDDRRKDLSQQSISPLKERDHSTGDIRDRRLSTPNKRSSLSAHSIIGTPSPVRKQNSVSSISDAGTATVKEITVRTLQSSLDDSQVESRFREQLPSVEQLLASRNEPENLLSYALQQATAIEVLQTQLLQLRKERFSQESRQLEEFAMLKMNYQTLLSAYQEQLDAAEAIKRSYENQLASQRDKAEAQSRSNEALRKQIEALSNYIRNLDLHNLELITTLDRQKEESENATLNKYNEIQSLAATISEHISSIHVLHSDLYDQIRIAEENFNDALATSERLIFDLTQAPLQSSEKVAKVATEDQYAQSEIDLEQIQQLITEHNEKAAEAHLIAEELCHLRTAVEEKEVESNLLMEKLTKVDTVLEDRDRRLADAERMLIEHENMLNDVRKEHANEISAMTERMESLMKQAQALVREKTTLSEEAASLATEKEALRAASNKREQALQAALTELREQSSIAQERLTQVKQQCKVLQDDNYVLATKLSQMLKMQSASTPSSIKEPMSRLRNIETENKSPPKEPSTAESSPQTSPSSSAPIQSTSPVPIAVQSPSTPIAHATTPKSQQRSLSAGKFFSRDHTPKPTNRDSVQHQQFITKWISLYGNKLNFSASPKPTRAEANTSITLQSNSTPEVDNAIGDSGSPSRRSLSPDQSQPPAASSSTQKSTSPNTPKTTKTTPLTSASTLVSPITAQVRGNNNQSSGSFRNLVEQRIARLQSTGPNPNTQSGGGSTDLAAGTASESYEYVYNGGREPSLIPADTIDRERDRRQSNSNANATSTPGGKLILSSPLRQPPPRPVDKPTNEKTSAESGQSIIEPTLQAPATPANSPTTTKDSRK